MATKKPNQSDNAVTEQHETPEQSNTTAQETPTQPSTISQDVAKSQEATIEEKNAALAQAQAEAQEKREQQEQAGTPRYVLNNGKTVDPNGNEVQQAKKDNE